MYGQLATLLGFRGASTLAHILGHVMHYCGQDELPPLTALVVSRKTNSPGKGLESGDLNGEREVVFAFDWNAIVPPTASQLAAISQPGRSAGYFRIRSHSMGSVSFRSLRER